MVVWLLGFQNACGEGPGTDTSNPTDPPEESGSRAPTGDTATTPSSDSGIRDTGSSQEAPCLDPETLDVTKWRGNVVIDGREYMVGSPSNDHAELSLNFYQRWSEPFEPGSEVRYEATGVDDCSLIYKPSLERPAFFYEEQGTVEVHLDGATYPVDAMEPYHGYGYYPYVRPFDDWGGTLRRATRRELRCLSDP